MSAAHRRGKLNVNERVQVQASSRAAEGRISGPVYPNSSTPASVRNTAAVLFAPFSLRAHPEPVLANRRVFNLEKQPKKNRSVFVSLQDGQTGKKMVFFQPFIYKNELFTKAGSEQT